jgi:hypothetical protein
LTNFIYKPLFIYKPFDTIKTKMQAQVGFEKENMISTLIKTVKQDGIKGLYRYNNFQPII